MAKQSKAGETEKKGKRRAAAKLKKEVGVGKAIAKPAKDRDLDLDRAHQWQPRYPGSGRLAGKVAIVTGGDSGIGRPAPAEKVATFGEDTPMKHPGEPNEVASCLLFLACGDSIYMSGQVLHPNGGTIING